MTRYEYAITDGGGLWWNGRSFGPEQVREVYTDMDDLPDEIETNDGATLDLELFSDDPDNPHVAWHDGDNDTASAWVEVVSRQEVEA